GRKEEYGPDLHEGRDVVTRRKQHPDLQYTRDEAVPDQRKGDRSLVEIEEGAQGLVVTHPAAGYDPEQNESNTPHRGFEHTAGADADHVDAHRDCDREGRRDCEGAPRAPEHGIYDDESEHSDQDHHDGEDPDKRR